MTDFNVTIGESKSENSVNDRATAYLHVSLNCAERRPYKTGVRQDPCCWLGCVVQCFVAERFVTWW